MFFGCICFHWLQPMLMTFPKAGEEITPWTQILWDMAGVSWCSCCFSLVLAGTSYALQGRARTNTGFFSPFHVGSLTLFAPTLCFPFLFIDLRVAVTCPVCLYFSLIPLSAASFHLWWVPMPMSRCMSPSSSWRRLSKQWFMSRVNYCFSTTDIRKSRKQQELIFSTPQWCPAQQRVPRPP